MVDDSWSEDYASCVALLMVEGGAKVLNLSLTFTTKEWLIVTCHSDSPIKYRLTVLLDIGTTVLNQAISPKPRVAMFTSSM